jgi:stress response protein YsnF
LFSDENDSDRAAYEQAVKQGNVILTVNVVEGQVDTVAEVLERHSPVNLQQDTTQAKKAAAAVPGATKQAGAVPVVEEELKIGKRQVLRGGVRVFSRVVEQPVEESIDLRDERVRVERKRVDRPAEPADIRTGQEQSIEVQEFAEEPVVSKEARVVEEVRIGKETSERTETVRDTVRHTEVEVEQIPGKESSARKGSFDDADFRRDFKTRYGSTGLEYETYAPAYQYGHQMASDPRYEGKSFSEVESNLRSDYSRRYPDSMWERVKDAVRYGWNKVTGQVQ